MNKEVIGVSMNFKGINNIEDLVRIAEWSETVDRIKVALDTNNSEYVLTLLEKELSRVKRKQKKYNFEVKKLKRLMEEVRSGVKVEDVEELLNNNETDNLKEDLELKEISTEEDFEQYNKDLESRKKLI